MMKNMAEPIKVELTLHGGSGDFDVVVYDRTTDQHHKFEHVTSGEYGVQLYFGERVVLAQEAA